MSGTARETYRLVLSILFTLPLVANLVAQSLGWHVFYLADAKVQLVWGTLAQFVAGWPFYVDALRGLRSGGVGLDLLAALTTSAVYLYSVHHTVTGLRPVYFVVSALLITLATAVRLLQAILAERSGKPA